MPKTIGYDQSKKLKSRASKDIKAKLMAARERTNFAMEYRRFKREDKWIDSELQYMNEIGWDQRDDTTADIVNVNISFSTIATIAPYVTGENPRFLVEPYSQDASAESARIIEAFINRLWDSNEVQGQQYLKLGTWDYLLYGDGYIKVNWEIVEIPKRSPVTGDIIESQNPTEIAKFYIDKIDPWDLWIDPYSDGIQNARYVVYRIVVPREELEKDKRYKIVGEIETEIPDEEGYTEGIERISQAAAGGDAQSDWITIYEYYDIKNRWMMTFLLSGLDTPIRYIEDVTCPIVQLGNHRIPKSPYHMGELEQIRALQEELNKTRSQMITHRRRNVLKHLVREKLLSEDAIAALKSSTINAIVPVSSTLPFNELVQPLDPAPIGADAYMVSDVIVRDIYDITGVNEYLRGSLPQVSRTATEATIVEGASNIKSQNKLRAVETAARFIGQLLLDIISDVIPLTDFEEMSLYVTGREAEALNRAKGNQDLTSDVILNPTPETFAGKYLVFVERGSTELRNPIFKEQKYRDMFQLMLNAQQLVMQVGGFAFNLKRAAELWLEAAGVDDIDAMFMGGDESNQLQADQIMQQLLMQGQGGPPGGPQSMVRQGMTPEGMPNLQGVQPPMEALTPENTNMLAPMMM